MRHPRKQTKMEGPKGNQLEDARMVFRLDPVRLLLTAATDATDRGGGIDPCSGTSLNSPLVVL